MRHGARILERREVQKKEETWKTQHQSSERVGEELRVKPDGKRKNEEPKPRTTGSPTDRSMKLSRPPRQDEKRSTEHTCAKHRRRPRKQEWPVEEAGYGFHALPVSVITQSLGMRRAEAPSMPKGRAIRRRVAPRN